MGRALATALGAVAITAVLLAGCGGSGDDGPSGDDFTSQLNKICAEGNAKLAGPNQIAVQAGLTTPAALPALQEIDGIIEALLADLKALDPPADKADHFQSYVGAIQKQTDLLTELEGLLQKVGGATPTNSQEAEQRGADDQRIQVIQTEVKLAAQEANDEVKALGVSCD